MIFKIFITIVFISELIIAFAIIINLLKLNKLIVKMNSAIEVSKPTIKDIAELIKKISAQMISISETYVDKFNKEKEKFILNQVKNLMTTLLFWKINIKILKIFRKSKLLRVAWKGFTLLQNMV